MLAQGRRLVPDLELLAADPDRVADHLVAPNNRVLRLQDDLSMAHVGISFEIVEIHDGPGRDAVLQEQLRPVLLRVGGKDRLELPAKR